MTDARLSANRTLIRNQNKKNGSLIDRAVVRLRILRVVCTDLPGYTLAMSAMALYVLLVKH